MIVPLISFIESELQILDVLQQPFVPFLWGRSIQVLLLFKNFLLHQFDFLIKIVTLICLFDDFLLDLDQIVRCTWHSARLPVRALAGKTLNEVVDDLCRM